MLPLTGPAWKLLHQLTGVRAADHPTAPVEALRDGAGKVVYGKEASLCRPPGTGLRGRPPSARGPHSQHPLHAGSISCCTMATCPPPPHLPPPSIRTTRAAAAAAALVTNVDMPLPLPGTVINSGAEPSLEEVERAISSLCNSSP